VSVYFFSRPLSFLPMTTSLPPPASWALATHQMRELRSAIADEITEAEPQRRGVALPTAAKAALSVLRMHNGARSGAAAASDAPYPAPIPPASPMRPPLFAMTDGLALYLPSPLPADCEATDWPSRLPPEDRARLAATADRLRAAAFADPNQRPLGSPESYKWTVGPPPSQWSPKAAL